MTKYFDKPFATAGDKTAVPDAVQPSGDVSYSEGYTPDYAKDQSIDPTAKDIPRQSMNQLLFDVTDAIKELQERGFKVYAADVNYPVDSYTIGSDGEVWKSAVINGPATAVKDPVVDGAPTWFRWGFTQAEIEALAAAAPVAQATQALVGGGELATVAETNAGVDDERIVTPLKLSGRTATTGRTGIAELATQAEADTGTDDERIVTPLKMLGGGSASIVANGYIKFPSWLFGGFIIQWATTSETSTPVARNFPTPFLNTVFGLVATVNAAGIEYVTSARSLSLTQYEIDTSSAAAANTFMIAFGK